MSTLKVSTIEPLDSDTTKTITIGSTGDTAAGVFTNTPSFRAYIGSNFTTSNTTRTIVPFGNVTFNVGNYFSTSTYRYTPLVAGYYNFFATVKSNSTTDFENFVIYIRKNETEIMEVNNSNGGYTSVNGSVITYLDGVDDFVDVYVRQDSGGNLEYDGTDKKTYFQGFKLIGV